MVWIVILSDPLSIIFVFGIIELPSAVLEGIGNGESFATIFDAIWTALPTFLILGILGALLFRVESGSGMPAVQHYCLRFVLAQHKVAP